MEVAPGDLATPDYDYLREDDKEWPWYVTPRKLGKPMWTEPYFDEGGGEVNMVTWSVPLKRKPRCSPSTTNSGRPLR